MQLKKENGYREGRTETIRAKRQPLLKMNSFASKIPRFEDTASQRSSTSTTTSTKHLMTKLEELQERLQASREQRKSFRSSVCSTTSTVMSCPSPLSFASESSPSLFVRTEVPSLHEHHQQQQQSPEDQLQRRQQYRHLSPSSIGKNHRIAECLEDEDDLDEEASLPCPSPLSFTSSSLPLHLPKYTQEDPPKTPASLSPKRNDRTVNEMPDEPITKQCRLPSSSSPIQQKKDPITDSRNGEELVAKVLPQQTPLAIASLPPKLPEQKVTNPPKHAPPAPQQNNRIDNLTEPIMKEQILPPSPIQKERIPIKDNRNDEQLASQVSLPQTPLSIVTPKQPEAEVTNKPKPVSPKESDRIDKGTDLIMKQQVLRPSSSSPIQTEKDLNDQELASQVLLSQTPVSPKQSGVINPPKPESPKDSDSIRKGTDPIMKEQLLRSSPSSSPIQMERDPIKDNRNDQELASQALLPQTLFPPKPPGVTNPAKPSSPQESDIVGKPPTKQHILPSATHPGNMNDEEHVVTQGLLHKPLPIHEEISLTKGEITNIGDHDVDDIAATEERVIDEEEEDLLSLGSLIHQHSPDSSRMEGVEILTQRISRLKEEAHDYLKSMIAAHDDDDDDCSSLITLPTNQKNDDLHSIEDGIHGGQAYNHALAFPNQADEAPKLRSGYPAATTTEMMDKKQQDLDVGVGSSSSTDIIEPHKSVSFAGDDSNTVHLIERRMTFARRLLEILDDHQQLKASECTRTSCLLILAVLFLGGGAAACILVIRSLSET